jgi:hypothetical protein
MKYVPGILVIWLLLSSLPAVAQIPDNRHPIRIGADQKGSSVFRGEIAAVRLYDRVLTPRELKTLAGAKPDATGPVPGAVREWLRPAATNATIANDPTFAFPQGCTIEAWIRPEPGASGRIVDKITPGGTDGFLLDTHPGNALRLICGEETLSHALPYTGRWTHVAGTVDAGGALALYVNGARVSGSAGESDGVGLLGSAAPPSQPLALWYRRPATRASPTIRHSSTRQGDRPPRPRWIHRGHPVEGRQGRQLSHCFNRTARSEGVRQWRNQDRVFGTVRRQDILTKFASDARS